jgi:hypothetical protein
MTTELTPINPMTSCEQITQVLGDYQKGTEDSKDYQARLARAEADQESALLNQALSDEEIAEEIAKLISLKAVLTARIERKQTDLARLTSELEKLHPLASREFTGLLNTEIDRRKELIAKRVTEALEIASDLTNFEAVSIPAGIAGLTQYSAPVRSISSLHPQMHWGSPGDGAGISAACIALLNNMKQFEELTK